MIEHRIFWGERYALITIVGSPSLAEYFTAAQRFVADAHFNSSVHRICDFSQADLTGISHDDLREFVSFALQSIPLGAQTKVALVAAGEDKWGIFKEFSDYIGTGQFRIFKDRDEARLWVTWAYPLD